MLWFPLINIFFLILIYRVHRQIFYIVGIIEIFLYMGGVAYIESTYSLASNQFLYYLTLTGIGLIIGVSAFFIAISLNHKHLYEDTSNSKSA